jgi:hypothetical protein
VFFFNFYKLISTVFRFIFGVLSPVLRDTFAQALERVFACDLTPETLQF